MYFTLSAWSKSSASPLPTALVKKKRIPRTDSAPESRKLLISAQQVNVRWMCLYLVNSEKWNETPTEEARQKLSQQTHLWQEGEPVSFNPAGFNWANTEPVTLQQAKLKSWQLACEGHVVYMHTGHLSLATDADLESLTLLGSVRPWQLIISLKAYKKVALCGPLRRARLISGTLCPGTSMSPLQGGTGQ